MATANEIYTQGAERILYAARFSTTRMVRDALVAGTLGGEELIEYRKLLEALRAENIPRTSRQEMWDRIGQTALQSLRAAYAGRKYKRNVTPYRVGDRFSGGALQRALSSQDMYRATAFGLYFINRDRLDSEAKQWRRLNFGAGGGGQEGDLTAPGRFPVSGLGLMIGLEPDVRPSFAMPKGVWLEGGYGASRRRAKERTGMDGFYAGGPVDPTRLTRGIAANNFFDAPMRAIGRSIKPGLDNLWSTHTSNVSKFNTTKTVIPPRSR